MDLNYLARGPHCWGVGKTREEAVAKAKEHFPNGFVPRGKRVMDKHFSIFTTTGEFSVNDFDGRIYSTSTDLVQIQKSILAD